MQLTLILHDEKGKLLRQEPRDFPEMACWSDVMQQIPKLVISHEGEIFGFFNRCGETGLIFRRKKILCV